MDFDVGSGGFIGLRAMIMLWPDKLICIYARFASLVMSAALVKHLLPRSAGFISLIRCILVVAVPPRLPLVLLAMPADLIVFQTRTGRGFTRVMQGTSTVFIRTFLTSIRRSRPVCITFSKTQRKSSQFSRELNNKGQSNEHRYLPISAFRLVWE